MANEPSLTLAETHDNPQNTTIGVAQEARAVRNPAVLLGIGGSGIQTITRVRSFVDAKRPDQAALDSTAFLGIDAVNTRRQVPPLPTWLDLATDEFLNICEVDGGFIPADYVRTQIGRQARMREWFDPNLIDQLPVQSAVDGLYASRMVGRIAFFRAADQVEVAVSSATKRAKAVHDRYTREGAGGGGIGNTIPVHVVASVCGGTGSSGLLEVLYRVWSATHALGLRPAITLYLFLPGVFHDEINKQNDGLMLSRRHQANAFASLTELDHFIAHADALQYAVAKAPAVAVQIPRGHLVEKVNLIDGVLGTNQVLDPTDCFLSVAEAIYQELATQVGLQAPLSGVNSAAAASPDQYGKRRIYASLGVSRLVYPGSTYRMHLRNRFASWVVDEGLLYRPDNLEALVRDDMTVLGLLDDLESAIRAETPAHFGPACDQLEFLRRSPVTGMDEESTSGKAREIKSKIDGLRPEATREIQRAFRAQQVVIVARAQAEVDHRMRDSGRGLHFGIEVMEVVLKKLRDLKIELKREKTSSEGRLLECEKTLQTLISLIEQKENGFIWRARDVIGFPEPAKNCGESLGKYATLIFEVREAAERATALDVVIGEMTDLRELLVGTVAKLSVVAVRLRSAWQADDLVGKDAGAGATTTLIPAYKEIEESALAVKAFGEIKSEFRRILEEELGIETDDDSSETGDADQQQDSAQKLLGLCPFTRPFLGEVLTAWETQSAADPDARLRYWELGSSDANIFRRMQSALYRALDKFADDYALQKPKRSQVTPRLPESIAGAAAAAGADVEKAVRGVVANLDSAMLSIDSSRLTFGTSVEKVVVSPADLMPIVDDAKGDHTKLFVSPDPERLIGLSSTAALSLHVLSRVDSWKSSYEAMLNEYRVWPKRTIPVHLDKNWYVDANNVVAPRELTPLVPNYSDATAARDALARGLWLEWLVEQGKVSAETWAEVFSPMSLTSGVKAPLRTSGGRFIEQVFVASFNGLEMDGPETPIGTDLLQLADSIGHRLPLITAIGLTTDRLRDNLDVAEFSSLLLQFEVVLRALSAASPIEAERKLYADLSLRVQSWIALLIARQGV